MSKYKKTTFNSEWLLKDKFKTWVASVEKDSYSAYCKICLKNFALSNMGEQALTSHMGGKKHKKAQSNLQNSMSLLGFYTAKEPASSTRNSLNSLSTEQKQVIDDPHKLSAVAGSSSARTVDSAPAQQSQSARNEPRGLASMLMKDTVTKAEILWCLHIVLRHDSQRSGGEAVELFPLMFPDSEIASKMRLQRTKLAYTINFGLAHYFFRELQDVCTNCDYIVIGFDESLNKVAQKGQMDAFVRFWNPATSQVCTRYYGSSFLGHATAADLMRSFLEASKGLSLTKLLQVSMDGPNVNKKFLQDLKSKLKEEHGDGSILLNLGSCGLHTIHNSYKKAMKKTGWDIVSFLRALYYLFCHSPARREDYVRYSGSSLFPLKFCAVRWVENFDVAGRALKIIPNVRKYVQGVKDHNKVPDCNSYKIVCSALDDKLLPAKLAFFQTIASEVEPFLTRFQSDAPLSPLLYDALLSTLRRIMSRFVKGDVLDSSSNIASIDLKKDTNIIPAKKIDLGFAVRSALRNAENVKDIDVLHFRNDCRSALIEFCISLSKNSPITYSLTRGISCFDPMIALNPSLRLSRIDKALDIFVQNNWLSGSQADRVKSSFDSVCKGPLFDETVSSFTIENHRLDDFWLDVIPKTAEFTELRSFLKMILILSHGNAFSERGFSVNKEVLIDNLCEESLIAQRRVYDALLYHGGVQKIEITKSLLHAARNAHNFYQEALKKKKAEQDAKSRQKAEKRKSSEKLKELEKRKKKILDDARQKAEEVDSEMKQLTWGLNIN